MKMTIDTGDARPIKQRPYRVPLTKRKFIEDTVEEMIAEGIVRPSTSPWASPITLQPKKDGTIRFCVDYRQLNAVTKKDAHPLPRIQDIFDSLQGATVFSICDAKSGYHQLGVAEDSVERTAFFTHHCLFEFLRMPFGLCNAPAVFQRAMQKVLGPLLGRCVMVYIDDIVIYSPNEAQHHKDVATVLETLQKAGLKLKPSKCEFNVTELKLLGYVVSGEGIKADRDKVAALRQMPVPATVKEVKKCSYYHQLIEDFAAIAAPLTALTRKHARFQWMEAEQAAFYTLRETHIGSDCGTSGPPTSIPLIL